MDVMRSRWLDVSRHQGQWKWPARTREKGIIGVTLRYTMGTWLRDDRAKENYRIARGEGFLVNGYGVMAPADAKSYGHKVRASDQVDYFKEFVGTDQFDLPAVADLEVTWSMNRGNPSDVSWLNGVVWGFVTLLHGYQNFQYPFIYTNPLNFWNPWITSSTLWRRYPLWVANYTSAPKPLLPRDWQEWAFWQHSADGNYQGRSYGFDCNHVDLNRVQSAWLDEPTVPPQEPEPVELSLEQKVDLLWEEHKGLWPKEKNG